MRHIADARCSPQADRVLCRSQACAGHTTSGSAVLTTAALAAEVPSQLRKVQALLPDTEKERFVMRLPGGAM